MKAAMVQYARAGIDAEIARHTAEIKRLTGLRATLDGPATRTTGKRRTMTAEERLKVSQRMKALWAEKRKQRSANKDAQGAVTWPNDARQ